MTADVRLAIRRNRATKAKAEIKRAVELSAGLKEPEPNEAVKSRLSAAAKQRELAAKAKDRDKRLRHEQDAALFERQADQARRQQLDEHWQAYTAAETHALAKGRGDALETVTTEVADWLRDERGVMIREEGLPVLKTEKAKTARRKSGLDWLLERNQISDAQYEVGAHFGAICARASQAEQPGRTDTSGTGGLGEIPASHAVDWRLSAMRELKLARSFILRPFNGGPEGVAILQLVESVCWDGSTVRDLAEGDKNETLRLLEKLKVGLSLLRYGFNGGGQ